MAELLTAVESGCGDAYMTIDDQNVTFPQWIDHMQYKMGLICLADADTSDFCLDVEKTWVSRVPTDDIIAAFPWEHLDG